MSPWKYLLYLLSLSAAYGLFLNSGLSDMIDANGQVILFMSFILVTSAWTGALFKILKLGREPGYIVWAIVLKFLPFLQPETIDTSFTWLATGLSIAVVVLYRIIHSFHTISEIPQSAGLPVTILAISGGFISGLFIILTDGSGLSGVAIGCLVFLILSNDGLIHSHFSLKNPLMPVKVLNWLPGFGLLILFILFFNPKQEGLYLAGQILVAVLFGAFTGWLLSKYELKVSKNILPVFLISVFGWVLMVMVLNLSVIILIAMIIGLGWIFGKRFSGENNYIHDMVYPSNVGTIVLTILPFFIIDFQLTYGAIFWGLGLLGAHLLIQAGRWLWLRLKAVELYEQLQSHHVLEFLLISPVTVIIVLLISTEFGGLFSAEILSGVLIFFTLNRTILPPVVRIFFPTSRKIETEPETADQKEKTRSLSPDLARKEYSCKEPILVAELDLLYQDIWESGQRIIEFGLREQLEETTNYILFFQEGAIESLIRLKTALKAEKDTISADEWKDKVRQERTSLNQWYSDLALKTSNQRLYQDRFRNLFPEFFKSIDNRILKLRPFIAVGLSEDLLNGKDSDGIVEQSIRLWYRLASGFQKQFFRSGLNRSVLFRELARFHFSGKLPVRAEKVVNLFHAETWYAISETNKVLRRVDSTFQELLKLTDEYEAKIPVDQLSKLLLSASAAVAEELQLLLDEIDLYSTDVEKSLRNLINLTMNELADDCAIAGTPFLSRKAFSFQAISADRHRALDRYDSSDETWGHFALAVANHLALELEIAGFQSQLRIILNDSTEDLSHLIRNRITGPVDGLKKRLLQIKRRYAKVPDDLPVSELQAGLREDLEGFALHCDKQIRKLEAAVRAQEGNQFQLGYFQKIHDLMLRLPTEQVVYDTRNIHLSPGENPPIAVQVTVDVRSLAIQIMEAELVRAVTDEFKLLDGYMDTSLHQLTDVAKIISFNGESVLQIIEKSSDDRSIWLPVLQEQLLNLTDRLSARLDDFLKDIEKNTSRIRQALVDETVEKSRLLKTSIEIRAILEYQQRAEDKPAFSYADLNIFKRLFGFGKYWTHRVEILLKRRYGALAGEMLDEFHLRFPGGGHGNSSLTRLQAQAAEAERKYAALPMIYRRLFSFDALETEDLLIGRTNELNDIHKAWEEWKEGRAKMAVAVVGDLGSGKTSLINIAIRNKKIGQQIVRRKLTDVLENESQLVRFLIESFNLPDHLQTTEQVRMAIRAMETRATVILDGFQKIMVRKPGGFNAARHLLNLIAETGDQLFWVVSINEQAWNVLNLRFRVAGYFPIVIKLGIWAGDDIRETLLARHHVSGYQMKFRSTDWQKLKNKFRIGIAFSSKRREMMLQQQYFEKLIRYSDRSILKALLIFIRSVDHFDEKHVWLKDPMPMDYSGFSSMTDEQWHLIAWIIIHGGLTSETMAGIFNKPEGDIRAAMIILANYRLLDMVSLRGTFYFTVNRWMYGYLFPELKKRGFLV